MEIMQKNGKSLQELKHLTRKQFCDSVEELHSSVVIYTLKMEIILQFLRAIENNGLHNRNNSPE